MFDCEANICHRERAAERRLYTAAAALPRTGDNNGRLVVELGGDDGRLAFEPLELLESGVALVERNSSPPSDDLLSAL